MIYQLVRTGQARKGGSRLSPEVQYAMKAGNAFYALEWLVNKAAELNRTHKYKHYGVACMLEGSS